MVQSWTIGKSKTVYASRTEAMWGMFFAVAGIEAVHEPFSVHAGPGKKLYRPDFYLPDYHTVVEVKNAALKPWDERAIKACAVETGSLSVIVNGYPPGWLWYTSAGGWRQGKELAPWIEDFEVHELEDHSHTAITRSSQEFHQATTKAVQARRKELVQLPTWKAYRT